jgi:ATP-dependent DNA helicase RecG
MADLDLQAIYGFIENSLKIAAGTPIASFLQNLKIMDGDNPTLAGILFFGEEPQRFVPFAKIIAAFIPGSELSVPPSDRKDLFGTIPQILDSALKFSGLYLREEHRIRGFEPETYPELPVEVLREGIVNAVAHRDYTINAPIRLLVFEDRIEIRTPGRLPNTVTVESMRVGGAHVLRNPKLYNFLYKIGMVTDIGSGVLRMIRLVKESTGKDIDMDATETEFVLKVPRK